MISNNNEAPSHTHPIENHKSKSDFSRTINKDISEQTFTETLVPEAIINYPDGTEYIGQVLNGVKFGKGILKGKNNEVIYEGHWVNDYQHGEGKQVLDENTIYIGEFFEGIISGKGKIVSTSEKKYYYEGIFLNGEKHGHGEEIIHESRYIGDFYEGKRHGRGKYFVENGIYYEGQFENDKINGKVYLYWRKGIFYWSKDKYYDGEWKDNSISGFGIFYNKEVTYKGHFIKDKKNGYGMNIYINKTKIIGKWVDDKLDGLAIVIDDKDQESLYIFKMGKDKIQIRDSGKIKFLKNQNEYKDLIKFRENLVLNDFF